MRSSKQFTCLTDNSRHEYQDGYRHPESRFQKIGGRFAWFAPDIGSTIIPIAGQDTRDAAQSSYQVTNSGPGYARKYRIGRQVNTKAFEPIPARVSPIRYLKPYIRMSIPAVSRLLILWPTDPYRHSNRLNYLLRIVTTPNHCGT